MVCNLWCPYLANLDQNLLLSLLKMTDKKRANLEVDRTMKKRIFHFMINVLKNLLSVDSKKYEKHQNNSMSLLAKKMRITLFAIIIKNTEMANIISIIERCE